VFKIREFPLQAAVSLKEELRGESELLESDGYSGYLGVQLG